MQNTVTDFGFVIDMLFASIVVVHVQHAHFTVVTRSIITVATICSSLYSHHFICNKCVTLTSFMLSLIFCMTLIAEITFKEISNFLSKYLLEHGFSYTRDTYYYDKYDFK